MAFRLVGQNCSAQITDGGDQDGTPNFTTAVPVKGLAKSISISETADTANFPALGDRRRLTQILRGGTEVSIEMFVEDSGPVLGAMCYHYVKFEWKELSTMTAYKTFTGVITAHSVDMPDGPTTEKITLMCDANGA